MSALCTYRAPRHVLTELVQARPRKLDKAESTELVRHVRREVPLYTAVGIMTRLCSARCMLVLLNACLSANTRLPWLLPCAQTLSRPPVFSRCRLGNLALQGC